MKFLAKTSSFLRDFQNKLSSNFRKSTIKLQTPIDKDPLSGCEDSDIETALREQLIKFFVEGNPANLVNRDEFFHEAAKFVVLTQTCSITAIRREFSIGFSRSKVIIDQLASAGIVKPHRANDNCKVLIKDEISLNRLIGSLPHVEIKNCIHLLDSFYDKYKVEIETRRIRYEKLQAQEQKKSEVEAIKLLMLDKILRKRLPDQEHSELIQTGRIYN
jgi:hypothetical protein